ncbi:MAG: hypothetical protein EA397_03560 [Deltaproteobacteria bacterium]|nr:MAG: hypothetical protein EA397_03560 [Deltaproteobacteria bacterium]
MVRTLLPILCLGALACSSDTGFTPMQHRPLDSDHGQWLSMKTAPDGQLAISFYDRTYEALGFAIGSPSTTDPGAIRWRYERVDGYPDDTGLNPYNAGTYTSLAFDPAGVAWVSYHAVDNGALKVARREGTTWTSEFVDRGSGLNSRTGLWTSLAIDANGQPVVVYFDAVNHSLQMARRTDGEWVLTTLDEGQPYTGEDDEGEPVEHRAHTGEYAHLLIHGDTETIAAYDRASGSLILHEGSPGSYQRTVVDSGGVGQWPSLAVHQDTLAIAYHDTAAQDLKLAVRQGSGEFSIHVVDDAPYRGADTAIVRRGEEWAILYFDGRNRDARVATGTEGGPFTHHRFAGETTAVGFHNELAQDGTGTWWAASYDYTNRTLFTKRLGEL